MRRGYRWFGLLALPALLIGCGDAGDEPWASPEGAFDPEAWAPAVGGEANDVWFVEFAAPPVVRGGSEIAVRSEQREFHRQAKRAGVRYATRLSFGRLWNGVSVRVDPEDIGALERLPGVKAIYPVLPIEQEEMQPGESTPELFTGTAMTGADVAQNTMGLSGEGVKVGIIDSGIDYDHPDLGGCFGPGCRVAYGVDLVGDNFGLPANGVPVEDGFPDDCHLNGHGTHVAGIVGANGVVKGAAPNVTYGAYRVFGCSGSTTADIMIKAMERAAGDGMRVVNMSIGAGYTWPQYPTAVAADNLVDDGVIVVTSGGNNGANGLYATGAPGLGTKVIASAAFENTHVQQKYFSVTGDVKVGYLTPTASPLTPTTGGAQIVATGTPTSTNDACSAPVGTPPAAGSLTGKIALIRRGGCGFYEKVKNAEAAGAVGVILYNNVAGFMNATVAGTPAVQVPVAGITAVDGAALHGMLQQGDLDLAWQTGLTAVPNPTAGQLASFSSYGPTADLTLKPDVGAPGGNIYSTFPLEGGGYLTQGGTSMASPHVAGIVALLLESRPALNPADMRMLLQNTAKPINQAGKVDADYSFRQGAGMARVDLAVNEKVHISPSKLSTGESEAGPFTQTITLTNTDGAADETFDLSHRPALSVTAATVYTPTASTLGYAGVAWSAPSVTVPAGGVATVDVTITPDPSSELPQGALFGGYLVFTAQAGGRTLSVPYVGFRGDYQLIQAVGSANLTRFVSPNYVPQPNGAKFTMKGGDIPYVTVHMNHQVTQLKIDAYAVANPADPAYLTKLKPQGNVSTTDYLSRNPTAPENFNFSWNGTTKGKTTYTVPNGHYVLKLSALKALGDPTNPSHWETWTSPLITIARQ
jgi:subtilisin family serine protease